MPETFTVIVNGREYGGWIDGQITLSLEEVASTFSFTYADQWKTSGLPFPIQFGDETRIYADGELMMTGFVGDVNISIDENGGSNYSIAGRSKAGVLIDSSAEYKKGTWKNATLLKIANDLAGPKHGIKVGADPALLKNKRFLEKFPKHAINSEEKIYACIERAARSRGFFLCSAPNGDVGFIEPGSGGKVVGMLDRELGQYVVLNAQVTRSENDRFAEYVFKTQTAGNDKWKGDLTRKGLASVKDPGVQGTRTLYLLSERPDGRQTLETRAKWEMKVRAARSYQISFTMAGWRDINGNIWQPNRTIPVRDRYLEIDETLLIKRVTLTAGSSGARAGLEFTNEDAYDVLVPPKKKKRRLVGNMTRWTGGQFTTRTGEQIGSTFDEFNPFVATYGASTDFSSIDDPAPEEPKPNQKPPRRRPKP